MHFSILRNLQVMWPSPALCVCSMGVGVRWEEENDLRGSHGPSEEGGEELNEYAGLPSAQPWGAGEKMSAHSQVLLYLEALIPDRGPTSPSCRWF